MSLRAQMPTPVPDETARVARAAFSQGNTYLRLRDELGTLFADEGFAPLYPARGQPAEAPWRLALVTVMQFAENQSDRQAADAVRARIDWKYALGLELIDPGFDSSVLCEFRTRLVAGAAEQRLLDAVLQRYRERGWLKARGRQRTDSTHVLARVRAVNRLECARETLRHALNDLTTLAPAWLLAHGQAEWGELYDRRLDDSRLPGGQQERRVYAAQLGADGNALLAAAYACGSPAWLREVPAVKTLRRVWVQQFYQESGEIRWRTEAEGIPPAGVFISSPYDTEARYARKNTTTWVGYKVHLTETCEDDAPHLISHVATTPAPVADGDLMPQIHQALRDRDLLPGKHLVDTGYVDAELLVDSRREFGVDLVGPTRLDYKWQAKAGAGFASSDFTIDWEGQEATCPEGRTSTQLWTAEAGRTGAATRLSRSSSLQSDCAGSCPSRDQCTRGKTGAAP